jgi:hypothetical protein
MANKAPGSPLKPAPAETAGGSSEIKPLTRRGYKRLTATERQIAEAAVLDSEALLAQAENRDDSAPDYLTAETLVCFIRWFDTAK